MNEEHEQPKLTGSGENLYAGKRPKSMPQEMPFESTPESGAQQTPIDGEQGGKSPDQAAKTLEKDGVTSREKKKKYSFVEGMKKKEVESFLQSANDSENMNEFAAGIMLGKLEKKSQEKPMHQWDKEVLFDEYKDWVDVTEELNDGEKPEEEQVSPEFRDRFNQISAQVRDGIIDTVNREHGEEEVIKFISGEREEYHRANNKEKNIVDADQIQDSEVRSKFVRLIQEVNAGDFDDMQVLREEMTSWSSINTDAFKKDPVARQAVEKAQDVLDQHMREHMFRRREKKGSASSKHPMQAARREDTDLKVWDDEVRTADMQEEDDATRKERVDARIQRIDDEKVKAAERGKVAEAEKQNEYLKKMREMNGGEFGNHMDQKVAAYAGYYGEEGDKKDNIHDDPGLDYRRKDQAWLEHKLKWDKLEDEKKVLATEDKDEHGRITDLKLKDWTKYGWTDVQREQFLRDIENLPIGDNGPDLGRENAKLIARELVLEGYTHGEAIELRTAVGLGGIINQVGQDRDEIQRIVKSQDQIEYEKERRLMEDPNNIYELGWQIGRSDEINFGESGKYSVWERRISREAAGDNVYTKDKEGKVNSLVQDKEGRLIEIDDEGYAKKLWTKEEYNAQDTKQTKFLNKAYLNDKNQPVDLKGNVILVDKDGKCTKDGKAIELNWTAGEGKDHVMLRKHEFVNKEHFIYWQRDRSIWLDDYYEQDKVDFVSQVTVQKNAPQQLSLQRMLDQKEKMFFSHEGEINQITGERENYDDLWRQMLEEAYALSMIRNFHLDYVKAPMHDDTQLADKIFQLFYDNHFTKPTIGKTLWYFTAMMPEQFKTLATSDGKMGAVIMTQYLGYYNISNFDKLTEVFGQKKKDEAGREYVNYDNAELFNLFDLRRIQREVYYGKKEIYGTSLDPDDVWNLKDNASLSNGLKISDVFDLETGNIRKDYTNPVTGLKEPTRKVKAAFINYINFFNRPNWNDLEEKVVDEAFRQAAARMHNLNSTEYDEDGNAKRYTKEEASKNEKKIEMAKELDRLKKTLSREEFEKKREAFRKDGYGDYERKITEGEVKTKMEKKDDDNSAYALIASRHMVRFTGAAAMNDVGQLGDHEDPNFNPGYPVGYDAMTRMMHFGLLRQKYVSTDNKGRARGGSAGNPYTIRQYKGLLLPPVLGITTQVEMELRDKNGNPTYGDNKIRKPILYVFEELNRVRKAQDAEESKRRLKKTSDWTGEETKKNEDYRKTAAQLTFERHAERHWLANQLQRATKVYQRIMKGEPLSLQGEHAPEVGYTINRDKLQGEVQSLISEMRYLVETYGRVIYNMPVSGFDPETKEWRTMSSAESMFGYDMLTRPEFMDKEGKIDPNLIQDNAWMLYKQYILTFIAGEFNAYRQMRSWSSDPRHDFAWYNNIIDLLEKIPAGFEGSEFDMRDVDMDGFFSHAEMGWFRKKTGTSFTQLYGAALLKAMILGDSTKHDGSIPGGISAIVAMFIREVMKK